MKKVIISFVILFLIASGFLTYKFVFMRNKDEKKPVVDTTVIESNKDSSEMEEEENEPITENNENDNDIVKNDITNDDSTSSNNMESNNVRNSNVVKENKTTTNVKITTEENGYADENNSHVQLGKSITVTVSDEHPLVGFGVFSETFSVPMSIQHTGLSEVYWK